MIYYVTIADVIFMCEDIMFFGQKLTWYFIVVLIIYNKIYKGSINYANVNRVTISLHYKIIKHHTKNSQVVISKHY